MNRKILIADDDDNFIYIYKHIFTFKKKLGFSLEEEDDFAVETFSDGQYLFDNFKEEYKKGNKTPLCILDMKMPRMNGLETASAIRKLDPEVVIILVTAYSDISLIEIKESLKKDIYYIKKPFNKEELYCLVDSLIKGWNKNQKLKESEKKYRTIFESFQDVYYRTDLKGIIEVISPSIVSHCGYSPEELTGKSINNIYFEEKHRELLLEKLYKFNHIRGYELKLQCKDGSLIDVSVNKNIVFDEGGKPLAIEGIIRDITDKKKGEEKNKRLESRLRQKQKLESIGTLAGGIAHDFNNILSVVIGYTYLALNYISETSEARNNLQYVLDASYHATDLVKQILAFSRQSDQEKIPTQVTFIIKESLKLLRPTLPATIRIKKHFEENNSIVLADGTQIHQVLMNLCTNAAHAMKEKGGELKISLTDISIKEKDLYENLKPGPYIKLTINDTGHGMDSKTMEHIFEPYFTTKEKGEGTGLGLAVVHGIVKSHNGEITVASKEGKGSTFNIYLPRIGGKSTGMAKERDALPGGNERILLIEDEIPLLNMAKKSLANLGYKVTAVESSLEGLKIFKENPNNFELIITDQTMPKMTGLELSEKCLAIKKDIPIILCTGFSRLVNSKKAKSTGIREFFMKPFDIRKVSKIIRNILDKKDEKVLTL